MPQLRRDPVTRRWIIIATDRAKRPQDFVNESQPLAEAFCPFCEGNEDKTPKEIFADRNDGSSTNGPGWNLRVVPNKYPALQVEGELDKRPDGMYDRMNGIGAHEVIIETPEHHLSLTDLTPEQITNVLWVYRDRLLDLERDKRLAYGMLFKNVGAAAGATLEHTHSQLIVTPVVPATVGHEMEVASDYFQYRGRCLLCDIVREELDAGSRIVWEGKSFVAYVPYAPRFPFETWILPREHRSHYPALEHAEAQELAVALKTTLMKIESALDRPAYNYMIHTSPFGTDPLAEYHWHIEIIPRIARVAGFEWGTGFYINPVSPEDAAAFLREIEVKPDGKKRKKKKPATKKHA